MQPYGFRNLKINFPVKLDITSFTMLVKRNATLIQEFFVSSLEEVDQLCWTVFKLEPPQSGGTRKILNSKLRFF